MNILKTIARIAVTIIMLGSITRIQADEVGEGAFFGATSGAIIGGAAGGGRGAGIGAGVGLGLGLIGGGIAKSNRQKRERRYQTRSLQDRREEYAHEEIMPDGDFESEDEDDYVVSAPTPKVKAKARAKSRKSTPVEAQDEETANNNDTVDTASEDEEYKDEEVMPHGDLETSYEDEI